MSNLNLILGIDPGLTGALAVYDYQKKALVGVWDMPLTTGHGGKRAANVPTFIRQGKRGLHIPALVMQLQEYAPQIHHAMVEDVTSRPNQGVVSTFRFGHGKGVLEGVLGALRIPVHLTPPAVWKLQMGLSSDKNRSREMAMRLFPEQELLFRRVKDDGRAEAALLAVFGASFI